MTLSWNEQPADVAPAPLDDLLRPLSALDVLALLSRARRSPIVIVNPACRRAILDHVEIERTELGGLLIGRAYWPSLDSAFRGGPVICVDESLPSEQFRTTRVSLAMETEIWDRARIAMREGGRMVVGWYHSHPDLGAFFSATDRATQRAFFSQPYSLGLVVDPVRDEEAWFVGASSDPLRSEHVLRIAC